VSSFVNSDPRMISVFMRYLRSRHVDEARIRVRMAIHIFKMTKGYAEITGRK